MGMDKHALLTPPGKGLRNEPAEKGVRNENILVLTFKEYPQPCLDGGKAQLLPVLWPATESV